MCGNHRVVLRFEEGPCCSSPARWPFSSFVCCLCLHPAHVRYTCTSLLSTFVIHQKITLRALEKRRLEALKWGAEIFLEILCMPKRKMIKILITSVLIEEKLSFKFWHAHIVSCKRDWEKECRKFAVICIRGFSFITNKRSEKGESVWQAQPIADKRANQWGASGHLLLLLHWTASSPHEVQPH
jgi:hypothetical protein